MLNADALRPLYDARLPYYNKIIQDIRFGIEQAVPGDPKIKQLFHGSTISSRVKSLESIARKLNRDGIDDFGKFHDAIEDIIGIRIVTPNKRQAKELFQWCQHISKEWFLPVKDQPKCTPYTIEDRSKHSLTTGYQAYHITFVADLKFPTYTEEGQWPVEIQIMSEAWHFWAAYSRKYFYGASEPSVQELMPFSTTIAKLFDSADDLIVATTDILLNSEDSLPAPTLDSKPIGDVTKSPRVVSPADVKIWLEQHLQSLVNQNARFPKEIFVIKLADELTSYGIALEELAGIVQAKEIRDFYDFLLRANHVAFLPPYQQILLMILLHKKLPAEQVLERINGELTLLGVSLQDPKKDSAWYG